MKTRIYVVVWALLLAVSITGASVIKGSYVPTPADEEALDELLYMYDNFFGKNNAELLEADPADVINGATCIVTARFTGERESQNGCFLSQVQISDVLKGDNSLKGKKIELYEQVGYNTLDVKLWKLVSPELLEQIATVVDIKSDRNLIHLATDSSPASVTPPMKKNMDYLLMIEPIENPENMILDRANTYVFTKGAYSKLWLGDSVHVSEYRPPARFVKLKDVNQYEILLSDKAWYQTFFDNKEKIRSQLKLK